MSGPARGSRLCAAVGNEARPGTGRGRRGRRAHHHTGARRGREPVPRSTYAATGATARPGALARARSAGRSPGMPLARAGRLRNGQGARAPPTGPIKGGGGRPAPTLLGPCPSRPGGVPGPPPAGAASFRLAAVCPAGCRHGVAGAPAAACALPQGFPCFGLRSGSGRG